MCVLVDDFVSDIYTEWPKKMYTHFDMKNIILHSHPEIEISFKFIPKILMSKECIIFFGTLCILQPLFCCEESKLHKICTHLD